MKTKLAIILFVTFYSTAVAQTPSGKTPHKALNIFINCDNCYDEFIKTEIKFVNYVRDRQSADVDLFITSQPAGVDYTQYNLIFIGLKTFANISDTLRYTTKLGSMEDVTRRELVQTIKLGLIRYVCHTDYAHLIQIGLDETVQDTTIANIDKWKSWVFNISTSANISGQKSSLSQDYSGLVSANKTTEKIKIDMEANMNYATNRFISGTDTINSINKEQSAFARVIRSINNHWSCGLFGKTGSATYNNKKFYVSGAPAIEYNFFPYSKAQTKLLTVTWYVSANHYEYTDTTIYDKIEETIFQNRLNISYSTTQPWGNAGLSLMGSHYINSNEKNHLSFSGYTDLRICKGLFFSIYVGYELVHDQIYLAKGGASIEEQLLQRKEIETSYFFNMSTGITYRFGSKYNNVVNQRINNSL